MSGGIHRIGRLTQIIKRWRRGGRSSSSPPPPPDVPPGHVAVIVGCERRRYVIRATHLSHPVFRALLAEAEEEYGFRYFDGPVTIPCDEAVFLDALRRIRVTRPGKCDPVFRPGECEPELTRWPVHVI